MNFERSLIAALLKNPEQILKHKILSSEIDNPLMAGTLRVLQELASNGKVIDLVLVAKELGISNALADLAELQKNTSFSKSNISTYIKNIKDRHKLKNVKGYLQNAQDELNANSDMNAVIGKLVANLSDINNEEIDHAYTAKEVVKAAIEHIEIAYEVKETGTLAGVETGIKKLDRELGGFHKSDLVVIGARPAMGKTAFLLTCALHAAQKGMKVGIVSTEMSVAQLGVRLLGMTSGIASSTMRDSSYSEQDWTRLTAGTSVSSELPLYVFDKPSCKVSDISMQAMAWKAEYGLDIIFVDYLTRLRPESGSENRTISVGNMITDLKTIARNMNIPVVVLAQLSRDLEKRADKMPMMSDLRDSGVIEQEADQVLMLYRDSVYNDTPLDDADIHVAKNRHGAVSILKVRFNPELIQWCDQGENYYD